MKRAGGARSGDSGVQSLWGLQPAAFALLPALRRRAPGATSERVAVLGQLPSFAAGPEISPNLASERQRYDEPGHFVGSTRPLADGHERQPR